MFQSTGRVQDASDESFGCRLQLVLHRIAGIRDELRDGCPLDSTNHASSWLHVGSATLSTSEGRLMSPHPVA